MISQRFKNWYLRYGFAILVGVGIGSCAILLEGCTTATIRVEYQDGKKTSCTATYGSLFASKSEVDLKACGASGGAERTETQLDWIKMILGIPK